MKFSQEEIEAIADYFQTRYFLAYQDILKLIGKRIAEIGKMSASDAHVLQQVTAYGVDIQEIDRILKENSKKSEEELKRIYLELMKEGYDFARQFYDAKDVVQPPLMQNEPLKQHLSALWEVSRQVMDDFSGTSTMGIVNSQGVFVPFREQYIRLIDDAVLLISTGTQDYQSAINDKLKEILKSGLRVQYESGRTREVYSAVRMNVLEGCTQVWMETQEECGRQYGADGVEISVHALCAPDHIHIQGKQYTKEEFEKVNSGLERPIGKMNCGHFTFPIVVGVSEPAYTNQELKHINNMSTAIVSSGGKQMTRYEASQVLRRYEARLRAEKAKKTLYEAVGDTHNKMISNKRIRELSAQYRKFAADTGLTPRPERTRLPKW